MEAHAEALTNLEVQNSALKATIAELQLELSSKIDFVEERSIQEEDGA